MTDFASVQRVERKGLPGRSLLILSAISVLVAAFFPPGIIFSVVIAILVVVQMPAPPITRRYHWAALFLALLGTAISLAAGIATSALGA